MVAAADPRRIRVDLSPDKRFSIDPELARLLASQPADVEVTGIWTATDDNGRCRGLADQLARLAQDAPRLRWRRIDPELDRPELERFASAHGGLDAPGLYLSRTGGGQGRTYRIPLSWRTVVSLQREVGAALVTLAEPTLPTAIMLQGQGELRPGGGAADGSDELSHDLTLACCAVETREGEAVGSIPASALLVIAGPTVHECGAAVVRAVVGHLRDGGGLLAFLDDQAPADLCAALRPFGILAGGFPASLAQGSLKGIDSAAEPSLPAPVVMSMQHNLKAHDAFPYANLVLLDQGEDVMVNPDHPASDGVAHSGIDVLSPRTGEVLGFDRAWLADKGAEAAAAAKADPDLPERADWLLRTAQGDAWIQLFNKPLREPRGLAHADARTLACACSYAPRADSVRQGVHARAVVWGSRAAVSDGCLGVAGYANADLVRASVAWLTERARQTGIADLRLAAYQASISDRGVMLLLLGLVVVAPCCLLGMAMLMFWDRR